MKRNRVEQFLFQPPLCYLLLFSPHSCNNIYSHKSKKQVKCSQLDNFQVFDLFSSILENLCRPYHHSNVDSIRSLHLAVIVSDFLMTVIFIMKSYLKKYNILF